MIDENGTSEIPGLMILSRVDTVGAGDSYLAGAAAALAAGYPLEYSRRNRDTGRWSNCSETFSDRHGNTGRAASDRNRS